MKKLLVTVSLFTLCTTLLMADLSPEYSVDVNSLKADNFGAVSKKSKKQTKKDEKQTKKEVSSSANISMSRNKTKDVPVYSKNIKITKVLKYSDVINYNLSHKLLKTKVIRGSVKKSHILTQANIISATRVLVFVQGDIRYLYFYTN